MESAAVRRSGSTSCVEELAGGALWRTLVVRLNIRVAVLQARSTSSTEHRFNGVSREVIAWKGFRFLEA